MSIHQGNIMRHFLLLIALLGIPALSIAQTCEMSLKSNTVHEGSTLGLDTVFNYHGLLVSEAEVIKKVGLKVIDVASKQKEVKGQYTITLDATTTCGGNAVLPAGTFMVDHKGIERIVDAMNAAGVELANEGKKAHGKKGKGPAWGKEKKN